MFFEKGAELWGLNWLKSNVKLKRIESLMVNWESICINPRPKTKIKKGAEIQGWCWSSTRVKLHKIKSSMPIRDAIERN
jgi:hypothetical protein